MLASTLKTLIEKLADKKIVNQGLLNLNSTISTPLFNNILEYYPFKSTLKNVWSYKTESYKIIDQLTMVEAKLITDCYEVTDAVGREEFCLMGLQRHIANNRAMPLALLFTDPETEIEYQEFLMGDGTIYRVPLATEGMDKYPFQKALEKMFVGDFIQTHSSDGEVTYTLLDTQEKVDAYNVGEYYKKYVWQKNRKAK
jgi:hypothetical protein